MSEIIGQDWRKRVAPSSFQDDVRRGVYPGIAGWNKFGYKSSLTAASGEETIWEASGNFTPITTASTFTIAYDGTGGAILTVVS